MRKLLVFWLLVTAFLAGWVMGVNAAESVRVFVTANARAGFVENGQADREATAKDLRNAIKKRHLTLVNSADEADIQLIVTGRGWEVDGNETSRATSGLLGTTVDTSKNKKPTIHVDMIVGDYQKSLTESARFWRDAALQVAFQVEEFVKNNNDKILASRR